MHNNSPNLEDISKQVLEVIKKFDLSPFAFGVTMPLKQDDFEHIAKNHPDPMHPAIILKTTSSTDGTQWYIQILKEQLPEEFSSD